MATKFMEKLFVKMKTVNRPDKEAITAPRADVTVEQYIARLKKLNNDKPFLSLAFLKNKEVIDEKLSKLITSTRSSYYNAILIALSTVATHKKLLGQYREDATGVWDTLKEASKGHEKNEKQLESIIPMDDVLKVKKDLTDKVIPLTRKRKLTEDEYNIYLQFILVSLFTDIPPRRNQDFAYMVIVPKRPAEMDKNKNYFITSERKFVFNKYKTAKNYDTQEVDVPDELLGKLLAYMHHRPDLNTSAKIKACVEAPLFINYDGSEPNKVNFITRTLNKAFGKSVGATALRHIYLSDKYADIEKEKEKDCEAMAHDKAIQSQYIKY